MNTRMRPDELAVYLVTDTGQCGMTGVVETVRQAVAGGATLVQLRDPDATDEEFVRLGRELVEVLTGTGVRLVVDDRVHLVEAIGADGVHVGQSDMPPPVAREMLGPDAIVGYSVTDEAELDRALGFGDVVDYLGLGPLYGTPSKPGHADPIGMARLSAMARRSPWPTCAIGGVKTRDAVPLKASGVDGMAVISAICGTPDPQAATRELAEAWAAAPRVANVLSIAGSDPGGGAGIQADLKSISANGAYGMCVITALTAQNTRGVTGVHPVPVEFVRDQLDTLLDDIRVDAVKIGMLASADLARTVGEYLAGPFAGVPIVLDPVMVATSGDRLLDSDATDAVRELMPLADLLTPNLPETAVLLGVEPARTLEDLRVQAHELLKAGARGVYAKGGHLEPAEVEALDAPTLTTDAVTERLATDLLILDGTEHVLTAPFVDTPDTHGTGCSLSSALAALRPQRVDWVETARDAKAWLAGAIAASGTLTVGGGHGPVNHFHTLWGR
ncbi:bifunctional hydroxymethylpyrimidine kinase/phosphomethylpyrimidine kinase [Mobilicoccus massiliensis]|uniref:bifunctional hydroxymethylpyrimidine kinase/phosphomethylpyrimidine kinase n=1 Tax=Mobilicoccus massiliensis TaxID=1522310 RepID=UPI0009E2164D|nr:bifunctional hydroxymethylpyrimidine kinase/phosphomethylpyrimidine kinase [Mobilicoccus massiliensis]